MAEAATMEMPGKLKSRYKGWTGKLLIKDKLTRSGAEAFNRRVDHMGVGLVGRTLGSVGIGNIGAELVAHATPDGYTLLLTAPNLVTSTSLYARVGFDPITPSRSFFPWTITRCDVSAFGSNPPSGLKRMKPWSSMWVTMNPISSMCAAAIARFSGERPFFNATTLPMLSVRISSARS